MQPNTGLSAKTLPPPLRQAAEQLLGRSLKDDEMLGIFTFRNPEPVQELSLEEWDKEMNEIIDSFPQSPLLSDEAISRESIYTREDEISRSQSRPIAVNRASISVTDVFAKSTHAGCVPYPASRC